MTINSDYKERIDCLRIRDKARAEQRTQARDKARLSPDRNVREAVRMAERGYGVDSITAVCKVEPTFAMRIVTGE